MRRIIEVGLKRRYETDSSFALRMRYLSALAFVPVGQVVAAFDAVLDAGIIPAEAEDVLLYFEDNWVGRPHRRGRRNPKFPLEMWNCYEHALKSMPKTNNSVEGWHTGFEATLDRVHPNIFKFLEAVHREQNISEAVTEQVIAGNPLPKKRKYQDSARRLKGLVARYEDMTNDIDNGNTDEDDDNSEETPLLVYLRGIAHNITFTS